MKKPPKVSIDLMKPLMLSLLCKILYFLPIDHLNLMLRLKKVFLVIMLCGILTSTRASPNVKFLQYVMNMSEASVESFRIKQVPDLLVSFLKETPWYDGPLEINYNDSASNGNAFWEEEGSRLKFTTILATNHFKNIYQIRKKTPL